MKKAMLTIFLFTALSGGMLWLVGCGQRSDAAEVKQLYTCGMHPQVIQDHPGNCPICGMKLTPIQNTSSGTYTQNLNLRTTVIARGPLRKIIRTVGTIDYNETAIADVTTKFKGWIEKLNVDATGQLVHRGETLFEVYSPELYSAQVEYLLAANPGPTNVSGYGLLRDTARNKLKFYDVSDAQIAELEKTKQPRKTLAFAAPMDGFVTEKMVVQGQMVDAGMKLYRLADLGIVWIYAQIYEQDLPYIQLGQEALVKIASLPDREFRGRVTFIYPTLDEKTRTAKVRLEFENPGYFLKPGMFVSAQIASELDPSVLLVPDSAVLRSGQKNTVFVALDGGKFDARTVVLGPEGQDGMYQVVSGLDEGDRVVSSGQFMLDSESQLNEAIEKMREPGNKMEAPPGSATNATPKMASVKNNGPTVYVCPMPEHVSITYDHPGNCPICNMALVPVTSAELKKLQPGGNVLYYTCPMPEHASVHEDKPGKCPICAMTLIPVMAAPNAAPAPAQTNSATESTLPTLYTCAMHPEVVFDKPGNCPICKMELLPTSSVPNGKIAEDKWRKEHAH
jgi:multidrug efflux pump subunit AcrA (membrane-fusion protein)